jgi:hypothetical protein
LSLVEADTKLGTLAKDLHATFRDSETVFSLDQSYYNRLAAFFEQTQHIEYANQIRLKLKQRPSSSAAVTEQAKK